MKSIFKTLALASMFGSLTTDPDKPNHKPIEDKETDSEKQKRLQLAEIERNKANGLQSFKYYRNGDTIEIWARNKKNADRKAINLGLIKK